MYRDAQDAEDAYADPARWKNGRVFQSHAEAITAGQPSPASWASAQVRSQGHARAMTAALAMRDNAPQASAERAFYAEAAAAIEAGILMAGGGA